MTTLSKKKDMGYAKINKRHAQESMMKKKRELDTWRSKVFKKKIGHMMVQIFKHEHIAHVQTKNVERNSSWKEFTHYPNPYTCTSWSRIMTCFLLRIRSLTQQHMRNRCAFNLSPYHELHISLFRGRIKRRQHFALVRNPKRKKRYPREQIEELGYTWFWKSIKPKFLSKEAKEPKV